MFRTVDQKKLRSFVGKDVTGTSRWHGVTAQRGGKCIRHDKTGVYISFAPPNQSTYRVRKFEHKIEPPFIVKEWEEEVEFCENTNTARAACECKECGPLPKKGGLKRRRW